MKTTPRPRIAKRLFDLAASGAGLAVLSPVFLLVALLIKVDSTGAVFFRQVRVGRGFQPFRIYKFRTMVADAPLKGGEVTRDGDPRITRVGGILRKLKIDELPQLINVFKGEMSLVGPRPEVPRYVALFESDYAEILSIAPGITDLASLKYRDESSMLRLAVDPEEEYVSRVLPDKIALAKEYVRRSSFALDISLILRTFIRVLAGGSTPPAAGASGADTRL